MQRKKKPDNDEEIMEENTLNEQDEKTGHDMILEMNEKIEAQEIELCQVKDRYLRVMAEFDNYKKRTIKEKECSYECAVGDTIANILPALDNLQRALLTFEESDAATVIEGVRLVAKQFEELLFKMGLEPISALGEEFDPLLHNAVMHIVDENIATNTIIEEFVKGYKLNDKVIRHSLVKVAN